MFVLSKVFQKLMCLEELRMKILDDQGRNLQVGRVGHVPTTFCQGGYCLHHFLKQSYATVDDGGIDAGEGTIQVIFPKPVKHNSDPRAFLLYIIDFNYHNSCIKTHNKLAFKNAVVKTLKIIIIIVSLSFF